MAYLDLSFACLELAVNKDALQVFAADTRAHQLEGMAYHYGLSECSTWQASKESTTSPTLQFKFKNRHKAHHKQPTLP